MMQASNWIEMMSSDIGTHTLTFFRTKTPSTDRGKGGYGYFCQIKRRHDTRGDKIPMHIQTFLINKVTEARQNNPFSEEYQHDDVTYSLTYNLAEKDFTLGIRSPNGPARSYRMTVDQLELLSRFLGVLGILTHVQPHRIAKPSILTSYLETLQDWATAKRAFEECKKLLGSEAFRDQEHFIELWRRVVADRYPEFQDCLERFGLTIRERIPLRNPLMNWYQESSVPKGYQFVKPAHEWHTEQLLISVLHDSAIDGERFRDCTS